MPKTSRTSKGAAQAAPTLAALVEQIRTRMETMDRTALSHALEVGALLVKAKAQVPRGQWENWVKENLGLPRVTSSLYMRLADNVQRVVHCKTVREADALLRRPGRPRKQKQPSAEPKRKPREAGKRLRALHARKRENDSQLLTARINIMKMVGILEGVDLPEYGVGDADRETMSDIHDELRILATWLDQSLDVVGAEMDDLQRRERIRRLREDTNGRTAAEIATARRLADKLERKHLVG